MKGNFDSIIQSPVPVVVDAFAEWCGPCKMQTPILKEVASELGNRVRVIKVDVDKNPEIMNRFHIRGVPTLMIFKDGHIIYKQAGLHTKPQVMKALSDAL
jgi:thioredoxin 1